MASKMGFEELVGSLWGCATAENPKEAVKELIGDLQERQKAADETAGAIETEGQAVPEVTAPDGG